MSLALDPPAAKAARPPTARAAARARDPVELAFLAAALALGLLRFVQLSSWSLWHDEALTLADSQVGGQQNPVGYLVFGWFYGLSDGRPDEAWMRLPAAVFGLGAIAATAWAFRPLLGARAAAVSAFLVASSVWQLYWSQNARFYTLAQLLALVGGGLLVRGLFNGSTRKAGLGLVALALAALTHPSAAFLIGPLLVVPWIARWLDWVSNEAARSRAWSLFSVAGLAALVLGSGWALSAFLRWDSIHGGGDPLHFAKTVGYLATPTLGLAFAAGALRSWRARESFVVVAAATLGLGAAALASFFARVSAQYVFVLLPWLAGCAALAILSPWEPSPPGATPSQASREPLSARVRLAVLALLVALPGLIETGLYFAVRRGDRPRWREAFAYVYEHRGPRDLVLGMEAPVAEYYLDRQTTDLRAWDELTWLDDWRSRLPMEWTRYGRRTWLVLNRTQLDDWTNHATSREQRGALERMLREECELVARFEVPLTPRDLDVLVYVTREPGAAPAR